MKKSMFAIPSLLFAGLVPMQVEAGQGNSTDKVTTSTFLDHMSAVVSDISNSHRYTLASHSSHASHASHASHGSHRSSSYAPPVNEGQDIGITPISYQNDSSRNEMSTPRSSVLPSSPAISKKVQILPGNSKKFKEIVTRLQIALVSRGFEVGAVNGEVHARTIAGIYDYQSKNGLVPTGKVTNQTLSNLGIIAQ
jgi:His-Xaa-Ser repeat protein HxsA